MIRVNLAASIDLPRRRNRIAFLFCILFVALEGHAIVDGIVVPDGEYPAVFAFRSSTPTPGDTSSKNEQICTGFLVHPSLILTAAHCLKGAQQIQALTNGESFGSKTGPLVQRPWAREFKSFPDYQVSHSGSTQAEKQRYASTDIGYIVLKKPVTEVKPLSLYVALDPATRGRLHGAEATLVGYGAHEWKKEGDYKHAPSGTKRKGFKKITGVSPGYFQMNGEAHGALPGDSGGPVFSEIDGELVVVGINHAMSPGKTRVSRMNRRGKMKTRLESNYGDTVTTLLTPENLCWVESQSKIDLPEIDCEVN